MLEYAVGVSYGHSFFEKTVALGAAVSYVKAGSIKRQAGPQ